MMDVHAHHAEGGFEEVTFTARRGRLPVAAVASEGVAEAGLARREGLSDVIIAFGEQDLVDCATAILWVD